MLQGHAADEISFIIRAIDERGFVWLVDGQGSRRQFQNRFDLAIAIDNGPIADYSGTDRNELPVELAGGPTIV